MHFILSLVFLSYAFLSTGTPRTCRLSHVPERRPRSNHAGSCFLSLRKRRDLRTGQHCGSIGNEIIRGLYPNTRVIGKELKISKDTYWYYPIGFTYRLNDSVGEGGAFLFMTMCHLYNPSSDRSILVGGDGSSSSPYSPVLYGMRYWLCYSLYAPPFIGHKHFDGYYRYNWFNPGREIWDDDHATSWSHTDMDGTVEIIENTNPVFSSIGEYVNSYFH